MRPVVGRQVSDARLFSMLGSRACLSTSGPAPAGWRVWALRWEQLWAPPFRLWSSEGQAGPQVSQTRPPLGVMPWSFAVIVSKYGYFCLQTLTNWIDGNCVKYLVGKKSVKRKLSYPHFLFTLQIMFLGCHRILASSPMFSSCSASRWRPSVLCPYRKDILFDYEQYEYHGTSVGTGGRGRGPVRALRATVLMQEEDGTRVWGSLPAPQPPLCGWGGVSLWASLG